MFPSRPISRRAIRMAKSARIGDVARWIEEGRLTVDASLATLDCMLRRQWIDEDAREGIAALFEPPDVKSAV